MNSQRRLLLIFLLALILVKPAIAQTSRLDSMSLEQRIGQMFMVTLHGSVLPEVSRDFIQKWQPGIVVLFTSNTGTPEAITRLTNEYQQAMQDVGAVPLLIAIDQEGGVVQRLSEGFTQLPAPPIIAASPPEIAQSVGRMVAEELQAVGINMNLAPVADLDTYRDNPIIRLRTFGNDPQIAGEGVGNYVRGLQEQGVIGTLKHFPGHGETREDSHGELPVIRLDRERLESTEFEPFRLGIEAGVEAVLVSHIWFPALESEPNIPSSLSPAVVTGVLRDEMGFDGLVLTDAIDMGAVDLNFTYDVAVKRAINAGVDIISAGPSVNLELQEFMMQSLLDAVNNGEISEARINESVERILSVKERYGLMDWQPLDVNSASQRVNVEGHAAVIDELFRGGVTIAYDRNNQLPLTDDRNIAIIFLATRYQIQTECSQYNPNVRWVGVGDNPSTDEIGWAREAANWSDTTVVFTQNAYNNPEQQALVNALPQGKTVAVALFSTYDWFTFPDVSAFVATYSPMRPAVPAVCAMLFGAIPAQGRMPFVLETNRAPDS